MYHDFNSLRQEVAAKQTRFQVKATRERLVNECIAAGQSDTVSAQAKGKRPWFLNLPFRLVREPK